MNLDSLLPNLGEWLRGTGPESDIVVSTRIRLARNLADFPFTNRATGPQKAEIDGRAKEAVAKADLPYQLEYLDVPTHARARPPVPRRAAAHQPRARRGADGPRGVAFDAKETVSLMVNEEDHLRLQVMRSGFALDEAWQDIDRSTTCSKRGSATPSARSSAT